MLLRSAHSLLTGLSPAMLTMGAIVRYGKAAKDMEVEAKPVRMRSSAANLCWQLSSGESVHSPELSACSQKLKTMARQRRLGSQGPSRVSLI